jgi:alkylation response protein AidB-like acyl-CoA dehydrogenase/acyl-CoA synthetase (AMP-forming)/AMP-acid ligase II/acyl carrier protein
MAADGSGTTALPSGVLQRLQGHAAARPGETAIVRVDAHGRETRVTNAELHAAVEAAAREIRGSLRPGDRALVVHQDGLAMIRDCLGCLRAGVVAVPCPAPTGTRGRERLEQIAANAGARAVFGAAPSQGGPAERAASVPAGHAAAPAVADGIGGPPGPDAVALLQYTSGSTGRPRGVMLTHGAIAANLTQLGAVMRPLGGGDGAEADVGVTWLPLYHDMGLIASVLFAVWSGFPAVILPPASFTRDPLDWLRAVSRHRATLSVAPTFALDQCVRRAWREDLADLDLRSLRAVCVGSEPVVEGVLTRFVRTFAGCGLRAEALVPCYGLAESTVFVSGGPTGRPLTVVPRAATRLARGTAGPADGEPAPVPVVACGSVAAGARVVVVDPRTRRPLGPGASGELWVQSPAVAAGYWGDARATRRTFLARTADGDGPFLRTGDLGFLHEGQLFVTGRLKDVIIVRGRNLAAADIERAVCDALDLPCNTVATVPLGGVDAADEGVGIVLELPRSVPGRFLAHRAEPPGDPAACDLVNRLRDAVWREFGVAVDAVAGIRPGGLPRTSSGKVRRRACRPFVLEGGPQAGRRGVSPPGRGNAAAAAEAPRSSGSPARADEMITWLRDYAERRFHPLLADERRMLPPSVVMDLAREGFFGLAVPAASGGCGLASGDVSRVMQQLAAIDLSLAVLVGSHNSLGLRPIMRHGTRPLRRAVLPELAAGRSLATLAVTESEAGSNPKAIRTAATRAGDGWLLGGSKRWVGMASWATHMTVLARAQGSGSADGALTTFLLDTRDRGVRIGEESMTMGVRAIVQARVELHDALVPADRRLGSLGEGWAVAQDAMNYARLGVAMLSLGVMKRCVQLMQRFAERRSIATGRLAENGLLRLRLGDLVAATTAVESLVAVTIRELDASGEVPADLAAACKIVPAEAAFAAADLLMQTLGGRGYEENNGIPKLFRDVRLLRIFEGPTENLVALLGATALRIDGAIEGMLRDRLGAADLAEAVVTTALESRASQGGLLSAAQRWQVQSALCGTMVAQAIVLAACRLQPAASAAAAEAAESWARREFEAARAAVRRGVPEAVPAAVVQAQVAAFAAEVGPALAFPPGEERVVDSLLRDADPGVEPAATRAPGPSGSRGPLHEALYDIVRLRLEDQGIAMPADEMGDDTPFHEAGVDSLTLAGIAFDVERLTGHKLAMEQVYSLSTINRLADYLAGQETTFCPQERRREDPAP